MNLFLYDTETHPFKRVAFEAPPVVCLTYRVQNTAAGILLRDDGLDLLESRLRDPTVRLVGMNVPYDLASPIVHRPHLLPLILDAYDADRITDVMNREKLADIAKGTLRTETDPETGEERAISYSLADMTQRHLGFTPTKGADTWRTRYDELDGVPLEQWPQAAVDYAVLDAEVTDGVYRAQTVKYGEVLPTEFDAARKAFALWLVSCWGFRVDPAAVERLDRELYLKRETSIRRLLELGLYKFKTKKAQAANDITKVSEDKKAVKARVVSAFAARGEEPPRAEKGGIKTDRDVLLMSKDAPLKELADAGKVKTAFNVFRPALKQGVKQGRIYAGYDPLVSTMRTSCYGPKSPKHVLDPETGKRIPYGYNFQQAPGDMGIRECSVADDGFALVSVDYKTLELVHLAQAEIDVLGIKPSDCAMACAINEGLDLHADLASELLRVPYREVLERVAAGNADAVLARKRAKPANFGLAGLMGRDGFINYSRRQYGVIFESFEAEEIIAAWYTKWPGQRKFQAVCKRISRQEGVVILPRCDGFVRGVAGRAPAACNTHFQSPAGYGAGLAVKALVWDCFDARRKSPLFGSRFNAFVHDETIMSHPLADLTPRAAEQAKVMVDTMQPIAPDVKVRVDKPAAMLAWSKKAESAVIDGKLVPYEWKDRRAA